MRLISKVVFFLILIGIAWGSGLIWFYTQIPQEVEVITPKVDAVVVLTGGSRRVTKGLQLLAEDVGKILMITGVNPDVTVEDLLSQEQDSIKNIKSIDLSRIILGYVAQDTETNAIETWTWVQQRNIKSICLVTSNYHMPRSLLELKSMLPDLVIVPQPVMPEHKSWTEHRARLIIMEYNKYLAAWIRIRIIGQTIKALRRRPVNEHLSSISK